MELKYKLIIILTICSFSSCFVLRDDDLIIQRISNSSFDIRLDGYWWREYKSNVPRIEIYFLYKDGTLLYGRVVDKANLALAEVEYKDGTLAIDAQRSKTYWGVFTNNVNNIKYEL